MSFYRKNPVFAVAMLLCAVLAVGELALIFERYTASRTAAGKLAQRQAELQGMGQLTPPPKREVASAIAADLAKAQHALASMQSELKGRGPAAERIRQAKIPVARTDAYFDLAAFVEKTRALAAKQGVDLRAEAARFGFAAYANEGPVQDHIEPVFRQRQIAQYLLEALIEAHPRSVLMVKRERTAGKAEREARAAALANGEPVPEVTGEEGPDYFAIDPRVSARVPGFIDTIAYQFAFTGQTAALRTFLNRLASFELPVHVREVQVDTATPEELAVQLPAADDATAVPDPPATAGPAAPSVVLSLDAPATSPAARKAAPVRSVASASSARATGATPIVSKPFSKFTVVVEFVELVPPVAPVAEEASPPPS